MMNTITAFAAALVLGGCAATQPAKVPGDSTAVRTPGTEAGATIAGAVESPLSDLNIVRAEIPSALVSAKAAPYAVPSPLSCDGLATEVRALDAALGPDLDTAETVANRSLIERGSDTAGDAATTALRGAAEGIVPFRTWVRKLTGAERRSKEVEASIVAGTVRRSYLKGLGQSAGCQGAAAPRR